MTHSPEPWKVDDHGHPYNDADVVDAEGESVIDWPDGTATRDDAERIVACVNFCRGIPLDLLEKRRLTLAPGFVALEVNDELDRLVDYVPLA